MILLVRRHKIAGLILFALLFALGMSTFSYLSLQGYGDLSELKQKELAERVFLVGIVGTLVLIGGLLAVVRDSVNLGSVFKRLSAMHRMGGDQIQIELRRLGMVGEQIGSLYQSINELSARKTTRLSGMNALLNLIVGRADANMLIVNAGGRIYQATPAALKTFELTQSEIRDLPVDKLIEKELFTETAAGISRKGGPYRIGEDRDSIVVLPVINDQGLVAYYVYLLGNDARDELKRNPLEPRKPREREDDRSEPNGNEADRDTGDNAMRRARRSNVVTGLLSRLRGKRGNGRTI